MPENGGRRTMLRRVKRPLGLLAAIILFDCASTTSNPPPTPTGPILLPGEVCDTTNPTARAMRFDPPHVVLAPGQTRTVTMTVDPDICNTPTATFAVDGAGASVVQPPPPAKLDYRHATYSFTLTGGAIGTTSILATLPLADDQVGGQLKPSTDPPVTASLDVDVRDGAAPTCTKGESAQGVMFAVSDGKTAAPPAVLQGKGTLASASLSVPAMAFAPGDVNKDNAATRVLPSFNAALACADDLTAAAPGKPLALGPAVSFTPQAPLSLNQSLHREIDFAIPVNPATFPSAARMRHLQVLFTSPRAKAPRPITIANPRIEKVGDGYALKFASPWFGTYQAAVAPDAGTRHRSRKLTHRAVVGFSMGAMGASVFGLRHHDQFDAIAPMGGPADWTWLLWYIENYALAGFCPASNPTCAKIAPSDYPIDGPLTHTMDFNNFWYQEGNGNGGHFPRSEYLQIFQDLSIMMGSAAGQNPDPKLWFFPNGPKATDPWVVGDTTGMPPGVDCKITVDPISNDPGEQQQKKWQDQCYAFRCALDANGRLKNGYVAPSGYYDAKYNPDGKYPVISFCDGAVDGTTDDPDKKKRLSPYENHWQQPTAASGAPVMIGLAVDVNGNGLRDETEPVISQGHEPYDDTGDDGLFDAQEPGYDAVTNPDPNQDDYDYQVNPNGTEGNHRHDDTEPYKDFGLDGVAGTAGLHIAGDFGESDGKYTQSKGLDGFQANDAHGMVHQWNTAIPGGALTDDALMRFDVWTDGGVRDLMNFSVASNHLNGALAGRRKADGTQLRTTAFYNGFDYLPGQQPGKPQNYVGANLLWADIPDFPNVRYGTVDATAAMITNGDGQHVGTADQLLDRLQTSFYFVAKSWGDADRSQSLLARDNDQTTTKNELGLECEKTGRCEKVFTGPGTHRTGPIAITLPPGYANEDNRVRDVKYPVLYVLHGYGQDPRDLEAVAIITNNFMNAAEKSYATRMPKFIVVYVDGRCRIGTSGAPECIRGTFWNESPQADGPKMDSWFMEVVDYIDTNYRTMGTTTVDVTD